MAQCVRRCLARHFTGGSPIWPRRVVTSGRIAIVPLPHLIGLAVNTRRNICPLSGTSGGFRAGVMRDGREKRRLVCTTNGRPICALPRRAGASVAFQQIQSEGTKKSRRRETLLTFSLSFRRRCRGIPWRMGCCQSSVALSV